MEQYEQNIVDILLPSIGRDNTKRPFTEQDDARSPSTPSSSGQSPVANFQWLPLISGMPTCQLHQMMSSHQKTYQVQVGNVYPEWAISCQLKKTGSCCCKDVQIAILKELPKQSYRCHCDICKKSHGGIFGSFVEYDTRVCSPSIASVSFYPVYLCLSTDVANIV